jgi:hypothetical protein
MFPDSSIERTKNVQELVKRMRNPKPSQIFANWAKALTRTATEGRRKLAGLNAMDEQPGRRVVVSKAKRFDELRRDLQNLLSGMSLQLSINDCSPGLREQLWSASSRLGEEFGCSAEFRPDGHLWFVKRGYP